MVTSLHPNLLSTADISIVNRLNILSKTNKDDRHHGITMLHDNDLLTNTIHNSANIALCTVQLMTQYHIIYLQTKARDNGTDDATVRTLFI